MDLKSLCALIELYVSVNELAQLLKNLDLLKVVVIRPDLVKLNSFRFWIRLFSRTRRCHLVSDVYDQS